MHGLEQASKKSHVKFDKIYCEIVSQLLSVTSVSKLELLQLDFLFVCLYIGNMLIFVELLTSSKQIRRCLALRLM